MKLKAFKPGATGEYPHGRADETDEGALRFALTTDVANGIVRLEFGTELSWIGLPVDQCRQLAQALLQAADHVESRKA